MTQDYLIGAQLDEYRLETLLGRGGMARVYHALDVNLNRPVAIKVIDIPHRAEAEYVLRFKREAQAIAQLDHPHIVRIYRYGEAPAGPYGDSMLYMAMQFIEGADLQFVLDSYRQQGQFVEDSEVCRVTREVCAALDYAHARGIIHRDIKSSNIMLDSQGRAILTDFGLAMLATQATRGETFGSPHYIAPEQAMSSAKAVPQSDLYALGVVLYEMITGMLPFNAAEPLEAAMMHLNSPVPSPRSIRPEISQALEDFLLKALEKQPEDRYQTGAALSAALDAAMLGKKTTLPSARTSIAQHVAPVMRGATAEEGHTPPPPPTPQPAPASDTIRAADIGPTLQVQPGEGTVVRSSPPTVVAWQNAPAGPAAPSATLPEIEKSGRRESRRFVIAGVLAGLLLLFLCLGVSGVIVYSQFIAKPPDDSLAGGLPELGRTPTTTSSGPMAIATPVSATATPPPRQTATQPPAAAAPGPTQPPTQAGPATQSFQIIRNGEDKGYFILINTGSTDLPLGSIRIKADKSELLASDWGLPGLPPGACLLGRKSDSKTQGLPSDVTCKLTGATLNISKKQEAIFKGALSVQAGGQALPECKKNQQTCSFTFKQ